MSESRPSKGSLGVALGRRRAAVSAAPGSLVKVSGEGLPLVLEPRLKGVDLLAWAASSIKEIEARLHERGGLLFRGFEVGGVEVFERFMRVTSGALLEYTYASTPRTSVGGGVYTSTEYPAHLPIPLHNEMSYSRSWPARVGFYCQRAAERGGETPVADSRRVLTLISPSVREAFASVGVMYVRNYGEGLDLSWEQVFKTESRAEVEEFCRRSGIEYEWKGGGRLRTRQVCQATARHPQTGEEVWFNQAHLFHVSALEAPLRERLLSQFKEEDLPRNAYYGDGSPIEEAALEEVRAAYAEASVKFNWAEGDILLLDNVLAAHGREPYAGARSILVGMA
jgi:alpha-ketoglutarate-dependent taurine dioxygenase